MENLNTLLDLFKVEMLKRGLTEFPNGQALAVQMADFCSQQVNPDDDIVSVFSPDGTDIPPNQIDDAFETLDVVSGECLTV